MATNGRSVQTGGGMMYESGMGGDFSGGFVSGIRRITLISESTVADLLSLAVLDEEQAEYIGDMWRAGMDEARDPETAFDASKILKMKWADIAGSSKDSLPWATFWACTELSISLSINGHNFYRIMHMHTGYDSMTDAPTSESGKRRRKRRSNNSSDVAA